MSLAALYFPCLLGMQCDGFTIIAADRTKMQSIIIMKNDEDKIHEVDNNVIMGVIGESGDTAQFANFVSKNIKLYRMKNGYHLNTASTVHFARNSLAELWKNGTPKSTNILIGGYDRECGAELYTVDFLASSMKVPFSSFGFGGFFSLCIMHEHYRPTLTVVEAYEVMKLCVKEINQRVFLNLPSFQVKVVSSQGIQTLPVITCLQS